MKALKKILAVAILLSGGTLIAQPSFYDLTFKADSTTTPYASDNNNYVFIRSKRGTEPVKPTSSGDSIKTFKIQKIVLAFSELNPSDVETREEYNQERWENLMATYPEFFQEKTTYKNVCQCSRNAGDPEFKQVQGFYIYYTPQGGAVAKKEPEVAKPVTTAVAPVSTAVVKEEPKATTAEVAKAEPAKKTEPKKETVKEEPKKEAEVAKAEPAKKTEPKKEEPKKEAVKEEPKKEVAKEEPKKETPAAQPVTTAVVKEEPKAVVVADEAEEVVDTKKNPAAVAKPRKAKDPRACRQACYGSGESDLNAYFKDNVVLTKKMKKDEVDLKIQLNVDGTVKKVIILGDNADLNKLVEDAAKKMVWNASVKGGLTIKSEVRMKLKFDKELKGLKANELMVNPRLGPKCLTCTSDDELQLK